jgi:hypothetical protein
MKVVEAAGYEDPAVEEFLGNYRAELLGPPAVDPEPGDEIPTYQQQEASPELPAEPGLALAVERVSPLLPEARCPLRGSFRLPVRTCHIVKPEEGGEGGELPEEAPTAVVPINLLLTGSVDPTPQVVKLGVPSYTPLETVGDDTLATGYFTVDLCTLVDVTTTPQTYFIYAFTGEFMCGPLPAAFVTIPESWLAEK